jgi:hypothetical protein
VKDGIFSIFEDKHFYILTCRVCHEEGIFNARCRTPQAEAERQIRVTAWKRDHECKARAAA